MKAKHNGHFWVVTFIDAFGGIQKTQHGDLQKALSMAFINRTSSL